MKRFYVRFETKANMDSVIAGNPKAYPIGTLAVDAETGDVYVAVGTPTAWTLIGAQ